MLHQARRLIELGIRTRVEARKRLTGEKIGFAIPQCCLHSRAIGGDLGGNIGATTAALLFRFEFLNDARLDHGINAGERMIEIRRQ